MENNALITFTMILPIIELCMGIANAVSVKDKIQYPINNPANIHSCDFVPFHAVLNTSDIINLGSIMYNICLLCVDTNVKYIVEKIPVPALFKPIISLLLSSFIDDAIELAVEYMKNEVL